MANVGAPPMFESPQEMQDLVNQYFESCKGSVEPPQEEGEEPTIILGKPVTITGLALYLGFESRQSFYDYEKKPEFSYIIKRARLEVESAYESNLYGRNPTGSIFALKNMGWKDKQEVDSRTTIEDERTDLTKLTDDELRTLVTLQSKGRVSKA